MNSGEEEGAQTYNYLGIKSRLSCHRSLDRLDAVVNGGCGFDLFGAGAVGVVLGGWFAWERVDGAETCEEGDEECHTHSYF